MAKVVRRSSLMAAGNENEVKVVSKPNPGGRGKQYDVLVDNEVEYRNVEQRSDAIQLYQKTQNDVREKLKNGGGNRGGFPGLGGGGGMPGLGGGGGGGGSPGIPGLMGGMNKDDDDDEDTGFNFPGF